MNSFLQTTKRFFKFAWYTVLGCIAFGFVALFVIQPLTRGWWLRLTILSALDNASSVRVVEHSSRWDKRAFDPNYTEITYATIRLRPEQIDALRAALPIRYDISGQLMLACIFEEHHYIEITQKDGSLLTLHICFKCGELKVNGESQRIMPWGWHSSMSNFIRSLGLRPDGPWGK